MAPVRPNRALCVPLQTKTRPRLLADTARNGSCLPDTCFAFHTIAPAAHDANKASNTKNGRACFGISVEMDDIIEITWSCPFRECSEFFRESLDVIVGQDFDAIFWSIAVWME